MKVFLFFKQYFIIFLVFPITMLITGCTTTEKAYHEYVMRGSILEVNGDEVYLCIGSKHGAQEDQILDVYHYEKIVEHPGRHGTKWRWEITGKIQITEVVDEHFAWAKVISGEVHEDDIAELE
jgi:hypothetical protein